MERNAHKSLQNLEQLVNRTPLSRAEREALSGDVGVLEQVLAEFVKARKELDQIKARADEMKKEIEKKSKKKEGE
ncbi:MAG: hypothetical protein CL666_14750 [Balneola sp.]|nr:hypothetical protein [Balneola sp.]|tara:strand:+ start:16888 stop:17112 length:225 start_codon:yes stop_codon:yes gene_type:complete